MTSLCLQVAHVIREIQHFQQMPYRIEHHKRVGALIIVKSYKAHASVGSMRLLYWTVTMDTYRMTSIKGKVDRKKGY